MLEDDCGVGALRMSDIKGFSVHSVKCKGEDTNSACYLAQTHSLTSKLALKPIATAQTM
jgi:hypothetical protein